MPETVFLLDHAWPLTVRRRRGLRRITLSLSAAGHINLTVTPQTTASEIRDHLTRATPWLRKHLAAILARRADEPIPARLHLPAMGEVREVHRETRTRYRDDGHCLRLPHDDDTAAEALRRWLRERARIHFPARLHTLAQRHGFRYRRLTIRHQRSRWGSCSSRGDISLNCAAVLLPAAAVDHLMLHELCHTVVPHHGTEFRTLLAQCDPKWRHWDAFLSRAMAELPWWALPGGGKKRPDG